MKATALRARLNRLILDYSEEVEIVVQIGTVLAEPISVQPTRKYRKALIVCELIKQEGEAGETEQRD